MPASLRSVICQALGESIALHLDDHDTAEHIRERVKLAYPTAGDDDIREQLARPLSAADFEAIVDAERKPPTRH